ncbi:MAG: antitoxin Xre/MbcA/ParS toxin-binding domain-containing protein [Alphaproteobacteria bacterium]|jgi:putative toxin-antitoxin system antitoxin component (TIGR02293 family)|nr:antitoxin Xre/MbcA/ParS toxin-binding domain-containing protein [Paracoccaceae bacterium]
MSALEAYTTPEQLPASEAGRIGMILGLSQEETMTDVALASQVGAGLRPAAADRLASYLGRGVVIGQIIPEATLRRARKDRKVLPREMSERLYEISRVVDAVGRTYHGDQRLAHRFLTTPHPLLEGQTPLDLARSSSAGADAVLNLLRRADAGFAL